MTKDDAMTKHSTLIEKVVEGMEMTSSDIMVFLDPATKEIVFVTEEDQGYLDRAAEDSEAEADLDDDEPFAGLAAWQRERSEELRSIDFDSLLPLPNQFDIHEWKIMENFAYTRDGVVQAKLLDAIHRKGAFKRFRRALERLGLTEAWYGYQNAAMEEIARAWLEDHGLTAG